MPWPGVIVFVLPPGPVEVEPILFPKAMVNMSSTVGCSNIQGHPTHLSLICLAIVKNACSTFVALFADVSRKGMFSWSANSYIAKAEGVIVGLVKGRRQDATDLCHSVLDDFLGGQVGLVAHKQLVDTLRGIPVNLLQPLLYVGERIYRRKLDVLENTTGIRDSPVSVTSYTTMMPCAPR